MEAAFVPTPWTPGTELPPAPSFGMWSGLEKDLDNMHIIAELARPPAWEVPTALVLPRQ